MQLKGWKDFLNAINYYITNKTRCETRPWEGNFLISILFTWSRVMYEVKAQHFLAESNTSNINSMISSELQGCFKKPEGRCILKLTDCQAARDAKAADKSWCICCKLSSIQALFVWVWYSPLWVEKPRDWLTSPRVRIKCSAHSFGMSKTS